MRSTTHSSALVGSAFATTATTAVAAKVGATFSSEARTSGPRSNSMTWASNPSTVSSACRRTSASLTAAGAAGGRSRITFGAGSAACANDRSGERAAAASAINTTTPRRRGGITARQAERARRRHSFRAESGGGTARQRCARRPRHECPRPRSSCGPAPRPRTTRAVPRPDSVRTRRAPARVRGRRSRRDGRGRRRRPRRAASPRTGGAARAARGERRRRGGGSGPRRRAPPGPRSRASPAYARCRARPPRGSILKSPADSATVQVLSRGWRVAFACRDATRVAHGRRRRRHTRRGDVDARVGVRVGVGIHTGNHVVAIQIAKQDLRALELHGQRLPRPHRDRAVGHRPGDRHQAALHLDVEALLALVPRRGEHGAVHGDDVRPRVDQPARLRLVHDADVGAAVFDRDLGAVAVDLAETPARLAAQLDDGSILEAQRRPAAASPWRGTIAPAASIAPLSTCRASGGGSACSRSSTRGASAKAAIAIAAVAPPIAIARAAARAPPVGVAADRFQAALILRPRTCAPASCAPAAPALRRSGSDSRRSHPPLHMQCR